VRPEADRLLFVACWYLGPPDHVCAGDPAVTSYAITFLEGGAKT
jgi:hypothetical protein